MNIDGPFHRFYQHNQWEKTSPGEKRLPVTSAQPMGRQAENLRQLQQRLEFHRRLKGEADKPYYPPTQKKPFSLEASASSVTNSSVRVVWLQRNLHQLPKALSLRTRFSDAGMQVEVHQWAMDEIAPLDCDLILLECFDMAEQELVQFLAKIRYFCQAPLIVLTDNHALDWSVCALRGGADAIFTVNMPDEVIVARSNALLRRWLPS